MLAECFVICASLVIFLVWSVAKEDVSGGFTIGAYIVGAGTMLVVGLKNHASWGEKEEIGEVESQIELI